MSENSYDLDTLQILTDVDHIRLRPGMYIGELENPAHLFNEAIDNALDESLSGYSDLIEVKVDTKKNRYTVVDYGRGIPIGELEFSGQKKEALELLCTKAFSGAKFNNASYRIHVGLHGLGLLAINALSQEMEISTKRNGQMVVARFSKGRTISVVKSRAEGSGVEVSFVPDEGIFYSSQIPLETIISRCKVARAFGVNIRLQVDKSEIDLGAPEVESLLPDSSSHTIYHDFKVDYSSDNGERIVAIVRYTSDTWDEYRGYTNLLYNSLGGSHVRALKKRIVEAWKPLIESEPIAPNDVLLGVKAVVAVFISDPEFGSQSKEKLTLDEAKMAHLFEEFRSRLESQIRVEEELRRGLLKRFRDYRESQNKLLSQKSIKNLVILNPVGNQVRRKSVVSKLVECTNPNRDETELFIVEGNSAGGSLVQARSPRDQAVLPIRGKILNVANLSIEQALKNEEVRSIVNSIGAGVKSACDPQRSRYGKIIILADPDPDGANISALLIGLMVNLLPSLVQAGMVYVAEPPLYGYRVKGNFVPAYKRSDIPEGQEFTRFKGLGEMDPDELRVCSLDPSTRKILRIEYPEDLDEFNDIMTNANTKLELLKELGIILQC